jgi:mono/diheme cytochrome c family protein
VWRALYFRADGTASAAGPSSPSPAPERGRYLVQGLGHCAACHAERNALGATRSEIELGGGLIPMQGWYAPALAAGDMAGVVPWQPQDVVDLLRTGRSARGTALGPMAEVVSRSTQYLEPEDLQAIAAYLQSLPKLPAQPPQAVPVPEDAMRLGARVYGEQCSECHGVRGQGRAGIYPPLAGNRVVALPSPNNLVRAILHGGFAPSTAANPRPYGMPPYGQSLKDGEIAALATFLRRSWGHAAAPVSWLDVQRAR